MSERDFHSKEHLTRHQTLNRYGITEEATRVNSWEEMDYLDWKLFLARSLTPQRITPQVLKAITDSNKYRRAYKSYQFGVVSKLRSPWLIAGIIAVVAGAVVLFFVRGFF